ncbi:USP6 N-terminal-like protein [Vulpes lagopus]
MQEDSETLLALQRANIVAQYHQSAPSRVSAGPVTVEGHRPPGLSAGQGAARPQPPGCQETPPGDPVRRQMDKNAQAMRSLPPHLRRRVYKGVPPQVRGQVWLRLLNVHQVKARNAGKYQGVSSQEMKEAALVSSRDITQVDPDVNRTFRSHTMFWDRYGVRGTCCPPGDTDEEQMSTGIYTPKWFLQCFLSRTPFLLTLKLWDVYILDGERVLTAMAYIILKVHKKRLLKLPLEGLREFLQDSLAQPWALEDEVVLRHVQASMTQLRRIWCDLPHPAGPEEFPMRPLGLERVSPAPGPLLPSPASETPPRVEDQASPGPATQPESPGPPPSQAIIQLPPQ